MLVFFVGYLLSGLIIGTLSWGIWSWYWNIHVDKPHSAWLFKKLRTFIIKRPPAMIILSISVVLGYLSLFARVLNIGSALISATVVAILEVASLVYHINKYKSQHKTVKKTRGPIILNFIFLLFLGIASSAFFFSFANYLATMIYFALIVIPTAGLIALGYIIFRKSVKKQRSKQVHKEWKSFVTEDTII